MLLDLREFQFITSGLNGVVYLIKHKATTEIKQTEFTAL